MPSPRAGSDAHFQVAANLFGLGVPELERDVQRWPSREGSF